MRCGRAARGSAFYTYQRGILATPEAVIWSQTCFETDWQLFFDLFSSLPLLAYAAFVAFALTVWL